MACVPSHSFHYSVRVSWDIVKDIEIQLTHYDDEHKRTSNEISINLCQPNVDVTLIVRTTADAVQVVRLFYVANPHHVRSYCVTLSMQCVISIASR